MKKRLSMFLLNLILMLCLITNVQAFAATYNYAAIPDNNLKIELLKKLGNTDVTDSNISTFSINKDDLKSITSLVVKDKNISSIEGLEYCTNLKTLNLNNNNITDLSPLSNLNNLKTLYLMDNKIENLKPISLLINLNTLWLSGNEISNITPLATLTNLKSLSLARQNITLNTFIVHKNNLITRFTLTNPIVNLQGKAVTVLSDISNNGIYSKDLNTITWNNIDTNYVSNLTYRYNESINIGAAKAMFAGNVYKPVKYNAN